MDIGSRQALANLNRQIKKIKGNTKKGMLIASLKIKATSQSRTPVDTGNLRASHYINEYEKTVEVGLTSDYAIYVHENLEASHKVGKAKFLESAIIDNVRNILNIIKRRATI